MTKRIFRSICLAALAVFLASMALILGMLYRYYAKVQQNQLWEQTMLAAQGVENQELDYLEGLDLRFGRITWIGADGTVLFDSQADNTEMENHLQREEIREALEIGRGESTRWSVTLMERSLYAALRLSDGSVLRMSVPQSTVLSILLSMSQPIVVIFLLALAVSVALALQLSQRIVRPLNQLDLEHPAEADCYPEVKPLLLRMATQQTQLRKQERTLRQQHDELRAVTDSMQEGMVLVDPNEQILRINPAAITILNTSEDCVGGPLHAVTESAELQAAVSQALCGTAAEKTISLPSGKFLADCSPVFSEDTVAGAALLLFDITEKERAEQFRRGFTANVSHELRTPLTSISGCAELLKSGLVQPEDVPAFADSLYRESQRMVQLVEDIISLSHLDEGAGDLQWERSDLYQIAQEAVQSRAKQAKTAGVSLSIQGTAALMEGIPQLLREIAGNLIDNAIKYNRRGGSVSVQVAQGEGTVSLTISDTGIGIPLEHQSHIFERFYRVDKSRFKAVGGTGLGLSIVKHAVLIHGGSIQLHSVPDEGTVITVRMPAKRSST